MSNKHLWPLACILGLLPITSGCGGNSSSTTPPLKPEFLYTVMISVSPPHFTQQLSSFRVDVSTGALSATSTLALPFVVPQMAVDPASKFLYLSFPNPTGNAIAIFSLDATTGVPTQTGEFALTNICVFCAPPSGPGALAMDAGKKILYYGSSSFGLGVAQGLGALSVNSSTGALSAVPGSPFPADQLPFDVLVHPSGQFVYTENLDPSGTSLIALQSVSGFLVNSTTGALVPVPGSPVAPPASADVAGFAIHPSGKFLYAATGLAANGILAWRVDATTGGLTVLPGSPFEPGTAAFGAAFDAAGKFMYVSAGVAGGISGFRVDSNNGALTPLPGSPFASGSILHGQVVDPSGRFLFAVLPNNAIAGFSIDATTGALTPLGSPTMLGARPSVMTIVKAP